MASEQLKIEISAQVNQAVTGLKQVETQLKNTSKAAITTGATALPKLSVGTKQATFALQNFGRVVQDAPFGILGIANNIDPLLNSLQQLRSQTGSAGAAFKALGASLLGPAGIAIGVSALTSSLIAFGPQIKNFITGTKEASKSQTEAADAIAGNYTNVLLLKSAFEQANASLGQRKEALSQLSSISQKYFGNLTAEKTSIEQLKVAYDSYIDNLLRSFAVKQLEADLEPLIKKLAVAQSTIQRLGPDIKALGLENVDLSKLTEQQRQALSASGVTKYNAALTESRKIWEDINTLIKGATILIANDTKSDKGISNPKPIKELTTTFKEFNASIRDNVTDFDEIDKRFQKAGETAEKAAKKLADFRQLQQLALGIDVTGATEPPSQDVGPFIPVNQEEVDLAVQRFAELQEKAKALQDTINNGINAGIDQFFNALANGQDPFKALTQSLKRFVAELGAAILKTLILQTIANFIAPGSGAALGQNLKFKNLIAGNLRFRL